MEKCWCVWWSNGALLLLPLKLSEGICYGRELTAVLWVDQSICIFQFLKQRTDLSCHDVPSSLLPWSLVYLSPQDRVQPAEPVGFWHDPSWSVTQQWENVPWHRLALMCRDSLVWSGFLVSSPLKQLFWNSWKWWNQWGHFKSTASPECFLEPALTQGLCPLVSLSRRCYHTNLVMSWLPALCRNSSTHCWGSYFHVGAAFPATLTPRTQLLSDRVARRGMIFL